MGWCHQISSKYDGARLWPVMVSFGMILMIFQSWFLCVTVTHTTEIILLNRNQMYFNFVEILRISLEFNWTQLTNAVFFKICIAKDKFPALTCHRQSYSEIKSMWLHIEAVLYSRPRAITSFCSLNLVNLALPDTNQQDEAFQNSYPLLNLGDQIITEDRMCGARATHTKIKMHAAFS